MGLLHQEFGKSLTDLNYPIEKLDTRTDQLEVAVAEGANERDELAMQVDELKRDASGMTRVHLLIDLPLQE